MLYSTDLWLHFHSFLLEKISQLLNKVMKEMVILILEKSTNTDTNFYDTAQTKAACFDINKATLFSKLDWSQMLTTCTNNLWLKLYQAHMYCMSL